MSLSLIVSLIYQDREPTKSAQALCVQAGIATPLSFTASIPCVAGRGWLQRRVLRAGVGPQWLGGIADRSSLAAILRRRLRRPDEGKVAMSRQLRGGRACTTVGQKHTVRSEEHTSELQSR